MFGLVLAILYNIDSDCGNMFQLALAICSLRITTVDTYFG